ncbi:MAG: Type 1 glutamine amidotransferase-like domain-containing protein [Clostridia bacterium]|nr:Type 1 glutamine amidotransferase-like domain-containing protein [Clostridia bacterium]
MEKRIIAIGGGDMKEKTTIKIDEYIANLAKEHAGDKRAYGLYIGTASHDFMPAFNTFRKTYTSVFDIKADCLLLENVETSDERIDEKISKADFIYVGGGDTLYMLKKWKERNLIDKLVSAYERGVILTGRSAGAICWFETMYTDSEIMNGESEEYKLYSGLGVLKGACSPHFNLREKDLTEAIKNNSIPSVYAIEDNSAIEFINGEYTKSISSGGQSYLLVNDNGNVHKKIL